MSAMMDMYFNSSESLSLQEMLDIDIKSEIDTLIGGHNDLSGFNFSELPPLEIDDVSDIRWFSSNSNSSFTMDFNNEEATAMVDPNAVMPTSLGIRSPSPSLVESHLTFSPSTIKLSASNIIVPKLADVAAVKKDLLNKLDDAGIIVQKQHLQQQQTAAAFVKKSASTNTTTPILKTIGKVTPILSKSIVKVAKASPATLLSFRSAVGSAQISTPVTVAHLANLGHVRTITATTQAAPAQQRKQFNNNNTATIFRDPSGEAKAFPKPAYSYSCLIAMALKNSKTGSLPVSEIYNFMCRHFPYFKTAPNGWKNSVRHNLSLNKCFEKIEKPAVNGAQRKGCLWAMNPSKISKMDDEVQKWSRKDPMAIRRAMVNPSNLEALERGELKFSCSYDETYEFGDSCGSAESEGSDYENDVDAVTVTDHQNYITMNGIGHHEIHLKQETASEDEEDGEEGEEFDVEVADSMYDDEDHEILRMEISLAQKELLAYQRDSNNKRRPAIIFK